MGTVSPLKRPDKDQPFRWNKRQGKPTCFAEWVVQHTWLLLPYTAVVVTAVLVLQLRGL